MFLKRLDDSGKEEYINTDNVTYFSITPDRKDHGKMVIFANMTSGERIPVESGIKSLDVAQLRVKKMLEDIRKERGGE